MLLSRDQIMLLYLGLDKYPEADTVLIKDVSNGSGLGCDTVAEFLNRGNLFRKIAPKSLGKEDITDVRMW